MSVTIAFFSVFASHANVRAAGREIYSNRYGGFRSIRWQRTHLMHLETMRYALCQESIAFLNGGDEVLARRTGGCR
jgi:hypothetical protein